jgi:hypothetical protein
MSEGHEAMVGAVVQPGTTQVYQLSYGEMAGM